jgi:hypothetical protein
MKQAVLWLILIELSAALYLSALGRCWAERVLRRLGKVSGDFWEDER